MLAGKTELAKLKYPLYASPKLDGVRGMVYEGVLRSRTWKEFPNVHVAKRFSSGFYNGLDGELIVGNPRAKDVYRVTNGALQRHDGKPDAKFYVFDDFSIEGTFEARLARLIDFHGEEHIRVVNQIVVYNEKMLLLYEESMLEEGYEGIMLRSPDGLYKHGRATTKSAELLKLKRFEDSEAEILSIYEEMHNANEAKKDAFGRTERSSHQANLVGKARLGGLHVRDVKSGVEFDIGTGFDAADREELWKVRDQLPGQIVKYKYFSVGVKDKPRHPVYLGPRHKWDFE
jgi:DNA ligase 1